MKLDTLHARSGRRCISYGCSRISEPKDDLCIVCQLGQPGVWADDVAAVDAALRAAEATPAEVLPWQVRVGREGALTGRVPVVKGRLVQAWAPRIASGLGDF